MKLKIIGTGILAALLLTACLKQEDKTGDGPKSNLLLVNAALDAQPLNFLLDGNPLSPADLLYGEATEFDGNGYLKVKPGIQTAGWRIGSQVFTEDKFLSWDPNAYYTLLHFDTARNGFGSWTIIRDQPESTDTSAGVRFINCIAGNDSLSLLLINPLDTVVVANRRLYLGRTGLTGTDFDLNVVAGSWRYELLTGTNQLLDEGPITISANQQYSFFGLGETGGVGEKIPRLLVVQQKK